MHKLEQLTTSTYWFEYVALLAVLALIILGGAAILNFMWS